MPTFFFDTKIDDDTSVDTDGVSLPDFMTAKREARLALCELTAELDAERDVTLATMQVRDGHGRIVLTLHMHLTISPLAAAGCQNLGSVAMCR